MRRLNQLIVRMFGDDNRQSVTIPVFTVIMSFFIGAILLLMLGKNPFAAYGNLLQGSGLLPKGSYAGHKGMITDFMSLLDVWTPMLFASMAIIVALKSGLFNIGVAGQMLTAGFISSVFVGYSDIYAPVAKILVLIIGCIVGALLGGLIGWLKYKFNINEVVSSIMINYIAQYVISFLINKYYINPVSRQSKPVGLNARLTLIDTVVGDYKMDIPLGIIIALATAFFIKFLLNRTRIGYEMKAVGTSKKAAYYAGINVGKNMVLSMFISGALAGLAGVTYYLGYYGSIAPRELASTGFDAIAVALLGNANPIGCIFSSLLITVISKGSAYMSSSVGVEAEIAAVITGIILLVSACSVYIKSKIARLKDQYTRMNKENKKFEGGKS